mmetsp:Transcript_625/g.2242  ORF Transcript_625/g.2242 Transcript_625/m.2242 type:complete len:264 (-) Transcript_625:1538-2329(-)
MAALVEEEMMAESSPSSDNSLRSATVVREVRLSTPLSVSGGERLVVVGGGSELGGWDPNEGVELVPDASGGDDRVRTATIALTDLAQRDYKIARIYDDGRAVWQPGFNMTLAADDELGEGSLRVLAAAPDGWVVALVGESEAFGAWDTADAVALAPSAEEDDVWELPRVGGGGLPAAVAAGGAFVAAWRRRCGARSWTRRYAKTLAALRPQPRRTRRPPGTSWTASATPPRLLTASASSGRSMRSAASASARSEPAATGGSTP